jgi:hypothetical protein
MDVIVAASESGSNEDRIEKVSPLRLQSKTPTKNGKKVKGTKEY